MHIEGLNGKIDGHNMEDNLLGAQCSDPESNLCLIRKLNDSKLRDNVACSCPVKLISPGISATPQLVNSLNIQSSKVLKRNLKKPTARRRFDLNKIAGSHFSHMISSSSKSMSKANSNQFGRTHMTSNSFEVQETIEVGNIIGFDMKGTEKEIEKIIQESGVAISNR